jgi:hypothetical protein
MWLSLCLWLTACATSQPSLGGEVEDEGQVAAFEELCAEEESLLPLCDGQQCGLYRCREVMESLSVGRVVPARAGGMVQLAPGGKHPSERVEKGDLPVRRAASL